jgi:hypothetical protein
MTADLQPSELRERILRQHREIESMLDELEAGAERLESGRESSTWLRCAAEVLGPVLEWHMNLEDKQLGPMLRASDAFGPVRAERLAEEHERQRVELETLIRRVRRAADSRDVVRRARELVAAIRADIVHEEAEYLRESLLRDDPLLVEDAFGG